MNIHYLTETTYNNGYEKGKTDGAREIFEVLKEHINLEIEVVEELEKKHCAEYNPPVNEFICFYKSKLATLQGIGEYIEFCEKKYTKELTE